jgi:ankyrin repeat protein
MRLSTIGTIGCGYVLLVCAGGALFFAWPFIFRPPHPAGYDALLGAINREDAEGVKAVLDSGVNPNLYPNAEADIQLEDDIVPLDQAAENGNAEIVELLLNHGADPNKGDGWHANPLAAATQNDKTEVMLLLIEGGAKVKDYPAGSSALWRAAWDRRVDAVKFLLDHGALANTRMNTPASETLLHALKTSEESSEIIEILEQHGAKDK